MKRLIPLATTLLLAGCGSPSGVAGLPIGVPGTGTASDALGGLPTDEAAHASVESQVPAAFALMPPSNAFVAALERKVRPMRQTLASSLAADATVSQGLTRWNSVTSTKRMAVLQRVATIEGSVMGCQVPPVVADNGRPPVAGMMAFYQPGDSDIGQVTIYGQAIATASPYLAIATVVHEMRHAAQFQLATASGLSGDDQTLASAYSEAWQAMDDLGGESQLAYGDYVHLNVEFDAFQTGNEVAALLSGGSFDPSGSGFVDVQYGANDAPALDLATLATQLGGADLVAAVNLAEFQAEQARAPQGPRQRHGGFARRGRFR